MHLKSMASGSYLQSVKNLATKANRSGQWKAAIGLEIHAQIDSKSKLFSGARTDFEKPVNTCVSLFDCATPGTLPVLNKKCVEAGILTALALSCQINEISLFDRKHYFYADLPTGYQITQQRKPLAINGELRFNVSIPGERKDPYVKISKIKQIQLEQDSGRSLHDTDRSLIDLNRAGIPLMELVFEPDLSDGEEAAALVKELILILQRLKTCSCKMEEGELRVDANVSVSRLNEPLGTRTEIKNIGSIRGVAGAIKHEINRQIEARERGEQIVNETLAWDAENRQTVTMRDKEDKQDYRFMPEPNLPPLRIHVQKNQVNKSNLIDVNSLSVQLPRLPEDIRQNLIKEHGLMYLTAVSLVSEGVLLGLFEDIMAGNADRNPKILSNVLLNEFLTVINKKKLRLDSLPISSRQLGELIDLLQSEVINLDTLKKVLEILIEERGKMPNEIIKELNLSQINDDVELTNLTRAVFDTNPKLVSQYKAGKVKVFNHFANEVFKKSGGRANMKKVTVMLKNLLQ